MQKLVSMSCPNCGGRLQVGLDIQQFNCAHCGAEWRVARGEGTLSLQPVEEQLEAIKSHTSGIRDNSERIAAELAIPRLEKEISALEQELLAVSATLDSSTTPLTLPRINDPIAFAMKYVGYVIFVLSVLWGLMTMYMLSSPSTPSIRDSSSFFICLAILPFLLAAALINGGRRRLRHKTLTNAEYLKSVAAREKLVQKSEIRFQQIYESINTKRAELKRFKRILSE